MNTFSEKYQSYLNTFNAYLKAYTDAMQSKPSVLAESMKYSLLCGGKRIRPVLLLATADMFGIETSEALPFAIALEMVHTYSLIHDDLPAMDNDDFRRGKPSNHKAFGEANAILAGDALLNQAYAVCFKECFKGQKQIAAANLLCECAGMKGMIAGQSADLYCSAMSSDISEEDLAYVHGHKTGKLLEAPLLIASILADNRSYLRLEQFGQELGVLFQITDDILDVTGDFEELGKSIGKDEAENKLTYVKLYGLEGAKVRADEVTQRCLAFLEAIDADTSFLNELVYFVRERSK